MSFHRVLGNFKLTLSKRYSHASLSNVRGLRHFPLFLIQ